MQNTAPLPAMDLSSNGFVVALAAAGRSHVDAAAASDRAWRPVHRRGSREQVGGDAYCLFCRAPEPVGSEEHILAVTLGNHFWVLPPNVVCGDCNHGPLARLDFALQQHPFISMIRTVGGVGGRAGRSPSFGAANMRVRRGPDVLSIEADHPR